MLSAQDAADLAEVEATEQAILAVVGRGVPTTPDALHEAVRAERGVPVQHAVIRTALMSLLGQGLLTL